MKPACEKDQPVECLHRLDHYVDWNLAFDRMTGSFRHGYRHTAEALDANLFTRFWRRLEAVIIIARMAIC
jgi:hypothetical protein